MLAITFVLLRRILINGLLTADADFPKQRDTLVLRKMYQLIKHDKRACLGIDGDWIKFRFGIDAPRSPQQPLDLCARRD
jgi:hypothetical protein